jgi:predicted DsbA family dithiol-disulfide isomerase
MYRAYFVDGLNIALIENLLSVVRQLGLPEDEAREVLLSRRYRDAVDADWRRCRKLGVTAVPTFAVGGRGVVGAQTYEVLERLVVEGGSEKP